ncbi:hypothetical protein KWG61_04620 [Allobaculum sp. Allo2]|nr:SLC13 family permease [Allobaculum sp. Allo2]UNT93964.1 hypothetical protein KWG61_04620 [Allobaculum sp. Allo2]
MRGSPNIIIGTSLGLTFGDFLTNTGLIAGVSLIATIFFFWLCFRKEFKEADKQTIDPKTLPQPKEAIKNQTAFILSIGIFLIAIVLLVSHSSTGLTVAFIGTFIALITLIANAKYAGKILKRSTTRHFCFSSVCLWSSAVWNRRAYSNASRTSSAISRVVILF